MDLEDSGSLSARSVSSLEEGSISSRSKKSKTLSRLRKLKKPEGAASAQQPANGFSPRPPEFATGEQNNNGLLNGHTDPSPTIDSVPLSKTQGDLVNIDIQNGVMKLDNERPQGLGTLDDPLAIGGRRTLGKSLFASPLDPVKPARRGLAGLEPLAPLRALEPLDGGKSKKKLDNGGDVGEWEESNGTKNEDSGVLSSGLEEVSKPHIHQDAMRLDGVVESETSDAHNFDLLPDNSSTHMSDFRKGSGTSFLTAEQTVAHNSSIPADEERRQSTNGLLESVAFDEEDTDSLDMLPDNAESSVQGNGRNFAVSAPVKQSTNNEYFHTVEHKDMDSWDTRLNSKNEVSSAIQEQPTHTVPRVTIVDDQESDDDLIMGGAPPNSAVVEAENLSNSLKLEKGTFQEALIKEDSRKTEIQEAQDVPGVHTVEGVSDNDLEVSQRTVIGGNDEVRVDDDDEDETNLKKYLAVKMKEIEEEEDSNEIINSSASSLSRAGRLSPITTASAPPPLPDSFMSPALRTAYKRDDLDDSIANSEASDALMSAGTPSEAGRSLASTAMLLHTLTNKGARNRNKSYLSGGVRSSGSLVGKEELDSHLPERRLRIFVATWNMHEDKEIPENLDDLLLPDDCEYMQDLYVIGTQESCPDIAEWEIRLQETLGPSYVLLHSASHGVLHCAVFLRRDLIWFCSPVEESRVSTRPGSMIKTKGAIAVSFNFFGTSFIFIVSHFTSGDENMKERLLDYEKILKGISLPEKVPPTKKFNVLTSDVTTRFDCVFWCGDFNFRLAENKERIEGWIKQLQNGNREDYEVLLQHDQLIKSMKRNEIFKGFQEGNIRFLPTYKFDLGEDIYDTSTKARVPSYTDRVLYKSRKQSDISMIHYSCCEEIKTSDHRPVYALFEAGVRPGKDGTMTGGGMFSREVFIEGNKRRSAKSGMSKRTQASSTVCSVM